MKYLLRAKTIVTPDNIIEDGEIIINNRKIGAINENVKVPVKFDLDDKIIFPGFINAHDHLLGNYYPRVGNGPYINWLPWDNDLKSSPVYAERAKIPPKIIYLLGSYRNLFSGVTTVSDHIPHFVNDPYIDELPIRVIKNYTLAHESSPYDLKWGDGVAKEYKRAVKKNYPFITHIEEGYDEESLSGIDYLIKEKALSDHTILIHAIGLSDNDIKEVAKRKAHIVWCPNSNIFMFGRTGDVKKWLSSKINVSLGTDSPMSGGLHILDELQFAKKTYKKLYKENIDDKVLIDFITKNPAVAFRISDKIGTIEKGKLADIVAISGNTKKPFESAVKSSLKDIVLVIKEGNPLYGDREYEDIFKQLKVKYMKFKLDGKEKVSVGDPVGVLKQIQKLVKFKKEIPFFPVE